jgi:hypothetical protein
MEFDQREIADDPVDLLLSGNYDAAIERYVGMYAEALLKGDHYIGADLCTQLYYAVAARREVAAQDVTQEVRTLIREAIRQRLADADLRHLEDDLSIARDAIANAKKRSERSVQRLDTEDESH